jgi:glycosyltransferase involved in cell wall biosynthesis
MPHKPSMSVIVPTYNSSEMLGRCLRALADSDFNDFEVIVVDDGSSRPLDFDYLAGSSFRCFRIESRRGPAYARNLAAVHAGGDYLVFVDSDVCVHRDTLRRFADLFASDSAIAAIVGAYDDHPEAPNFVSQYKNLAHSFVHRNSEGPISTFWTGCGAVRREVFLSVGGFDSSSYIHPSVEDIELGNRIASRDLRIVLDGRIQATHLKRWTFRSLVRTDIFDRGIPWTRLMLRGGKLINTLNARISQRISVILAFFTVLALGAAVRFPAAGIAALVFASVTLSLNLNLFRFFSQRRGNWFAACAMLMHWLYLLYCGFSFVAGAALHYFSQADIQIVFSSAREPKNIA